VGHLLVPANLRGVERGGRAKREIVPPEMMRAVLAEARQQLDDASSRHVLVDARRVAENAHQAVLGQRAARPPVVGVVLEPVVRDLVMNVAFVKQRDEDVDVQERYRHQSSSSAQRRTSAVVMRRAPGWRGRIGTPFRTLKLRAGSSALRISSDTI